MKLKYSNRLLTLGILIPFTLTGYAASYSVDCNSDGSNSAVLQPALNALASGDALSIKGKCVGSFTVTVNNLENTAVTIDGNNVAELVGNGVTPVIDISNTSNILIKGIKIYTEYDTNNAPYPSEGRGINNSGKLELTNSSITKGVATKGGAILNSGTLTINSTLLEKNYVGDWDVEAHQPLPGYGGGIYNAGTLNLNDSTLRSNNILGSDESRGGGIYNKGNLIVNRSTFYDNNSLLLIFGIPAGGPGGAIANSATGTVKVFNSTFDYNFGSAGGVIHSSNTAPGSIIVKNSTMTGNIGYIMAGAIISHPETLTIENSIVAKNENAQGEQDNIVNTYHVVGTNFIGGGTQDPVLDPKLEALADNGGPTQTMKPLADSPAINGTNCNAETQDQRGAPRPGIAGAGVKSKCDIGAYETGDAKIGLDTPSNGTLDFGAVEMSYHSTLPVILKNSGNSDLTFTGAPTSDSAKFVVGAFDASTILKATGYRDFNVTYTPTENTTDTGNLSIGSNDANSVLNIAMQGQGTGFAIPPGHQISVLLAFIDANVPENLYGISPNNNQKTADNRVNAFKNMIKTAGDLINTNDFNKACVQLSDAEKKVDGENRPPDFIGGAKVQELHAMIVNLMSDLGCSS